MEAEQLVREYESSGLIREAFWAGHGLTVAALDMYRRRHCRARESGEGRLVPVEVLSRISTATSGGSALWVELPNGRRIGTMAADRVAGRREGTHQILAVESVRVDPSAQTGCHPQTALAHRARLRRTEAGTWPGTFRRPELARVSSSCNLIHRSLRLPGPGAVPFPPLSQLAANRSSHHPSSNTPNAIRLHAPRRYP